MKFLYSKHTHTLTIMPSATSAWRLSEKIVFSLLVLALVAPERLRAQADTSFWFAAPEISPALNMDRPIMLRIATLGQASIVTISMPANGAFTPITVQIPANGTQSVDLTPWINSIEASPPDVVLDKGLKVVASTVVEAYYENVSGDNQTCQNAIRKYLFLRAEIA